MNAKPDIRAMTVEQLAAQLQPEWPAWRARQVVDWLQKGADFRQMSNLPAALRQQLAERYSLAGVTVEKKYVSAADGTVKYGFLLADGERIESVLMQYRHGWSQCISTQAGCRMGCAFCATGRDGWRRNLTAGEMLSEIETAQADHGVRVSSVVLMGMGEPLDNYDHVVAFLDRLAEPGGVQIGMRHISLSTCGLVDRIEQLMQRRYQLTLSVSLHAPNNAIRDRLMPVNRKWPVETLLTACRAYAEETGRRISFEYAMVDGVNDTDACAAELAARLCGMLCHVNLIPINTVEGTPWRASSRQRIAAFTKVLESKGIVTTVRRTLGADIEASCGQLRRRLQAEKRESQ